MEHINRDSRIFYYAGSDNAIQTTLDFDFACGKPKPSLVGLIKPGKRGTQIHFWGSQPILLPTYPSLTSAMAHHPDVVAVVNFASKRNARQVAEEIIAFPTVRYQVIIAEGIAERDMRIVRQKAKKAKHTIFGPSIFGIIIAGTIQLGPAGGGVELQARAGLHQTGHVAVVTKSGGLVNEFAHIVAQATGSVHSIIAIGGDRFPGTTLCEVFNLLEPDPQVKLVVMQGEVGGRQEIAVADAIKDGTLTKPIVAYTTGIAADSFPREFQFGHAGAQAVQDDESAVRKNQILREAGARVPDSFEQLGEVVKKQATRLKISANDPYELDTALFQNRHKPGIVSTITDDSSGIPLYNGNSALDLATNPDISIAEVIGHLWLKKNIPPVLADFINVFLKLTADHGPNVAGAHNTIVTARAGKDLMSSLAAGLLTIGPRFGGASGSAANVWYQGVHTNTSARALVDTMNKKHEPIPGIGHRIKNRFNPDQRVELLQQFATERLVQTRYLDFARAVEAITLAKNHSLILNIDGMLGAVALDVFVEAGSTNEELEEYLSYDILDGLFVLSRSIGLIGHYIDQKRLGAPLYRHDPNDTFIAT